MAKEIAIDLRINTATASEGVEELNSLLGDTDQSLEKIGQTGTGDLEKRFDDLNKLIKNTPAGIKDITKNIELYKDIALAAGKESPIGQKAIAEAAVLKNQLGDLTQEIRNVAKNSQSMKAALQLSSSIIAGYGLAQSATAVLGFENENLQNTFVKLQAAQTALVSIEQVRIALEEKSFVMLKLTAFWNKAVALSTVLMAKAKGVDATATVVATTATRAFTAALIATGIGAIVVGLALLVANFDKVSEAVQKAGTWLRDLYFKFKDLGTIAKVAISILFPIVGVMFAIGAAMEKFGVIETQQAKISRIASEMKAEAARVAAKQYIESIDAQKEALQKATDENVANIDYEIAKLNAAGKDSKKLEREKIEVLLASTEEQIRLSELRNEAVIKEMQILAKLSNFAGDAAKERLKEIEDESLNMKSTLLGLEQDLELFDIKQETAKKAVRKKNAEGRKKETKAIIDEELERLKQLAEIREAQRIAAIDAEEKATEDYRVRQLNAEQKELEDLSNKYFEDQQAFRDNEEMLLLIEAEYEARRKEIEKGYSDERKAEKDAEHAAGVKADQAAKQRMLDNALTYTQAVGSIQKSLFDVANNLGDQGVKSQEKRARRQFAIEKALGITETAINTAKGVLKYIAEKNMPMAVVTGVVGAATIAKISSQQFGSIGSAQSVMPSVSGSSSNSPTANNQNDNTTNVNDLLTPPSAPIMQPVLVLDTFAKVNDKQKKITALSTF